ncbi:hypothetical protein DIPPA_04024 [Diplonema papillatum]|nr:hypothetical protein DIPPA_04024 [Diplonema papillatum]
MLDAETRKELTGAAEAEAYAILDRFVAVNYGDDDDVEEADDAEMLEPTTWPENPSPVQRGSREVVPLQRKPGPSGEEGWRGGEDSGALVLEGSW